MQCLVGCLALALPRVALALVWLTSDYLQRAYETVLWPLLGFLFLPLTTLVYAWVMNSRGEVQGLGLAAIVIAVLVDLGLVGGARKRKE